MNLRSSIPWYGKIAAKLVLSHVPAAYAFWHRLNLFSHGSMDRPNYAFEVFSTHFARTSFEAKGRAYVAMEIGPGDSAMSALIARAFGATNCYLVDAGNFATQAIEPYRRMARLLAERGLEAPDIDDADSLEEILARCCTQYLTNGLASLRDIPSSSVDFIWSQAVLEHVRRDDFLPTMKELCRVLSRGGACSHRVDLTDHLGGGLNNMRIPSRWWEEDWMAQSGFYTNRLRMSELLQLFQKAGFSTEVIGLSRWDEVPIRRRSLAREFHHFDDADLMIKGFDVVLRPA